MSSLCFDNPFYNQALRRWCSPPRNETLKKRTTDLPQTLDACAWTQQYQRSDRLQDVGALTSFGFHSDFKTPVRLQPVSRFSSITPSDPSSNTAPDATKLSSSPNIKMKLEYMSSSSPCLQRKRSFIEAPYLSPKSYFRLPSSQVVQQETAATIPFSDDLLILEKGEASVEDTCSPSHLDHPCRMTSLPFTKSQKNKRKRHARSEKKKRAKLQRLQSSLFSNAPHPPITPCRYFSVTETQSPLPYDQLPPCHLSSQETHMLIPRNGHRFALHGIFPHTNEIFLKQAYYDTDIRNQLLQWLYINQAPYSYMEDTKITFREHAKRYYIDIIWPKEAPTLAPTSLFNINFNLYFDNVKASYQGTGSICSPHQITIGTHLESSGDISGLLDAIKEAFPPSVKMIGVWYDETVVMMLNEGNEWKGNTKLLVDLEDPNLIPVQGIKKTVRELPGWVSFNNTAYHLQYLNRRPWCSRCKGEAIQFHTLEECPKVEKCKDDHREEECRQETKAANDFNYQPSLCLSDQQWTFSNDFKKRRLMQCDVA